MENKYWEKYVDLNNEKDKQREKKKRKRMPVSGKSVFEIVKIKFTKGRKKE